jgi:2-dehydropantoate 2-reductase
MYEPGIVVRQSPPSRSWFAVGAFDDAARGREPEVADVLRHSGTVEISDDIRSSKWMKLVANAAELVPSAILNLPLADAVRAPGMRDFMVTAGREAVTTALATGNKLVPIFGMRDSDVSAPEEYAEQLLDAVLAHYTLPDTRTTVLQDWMKGRRSEVDQINGLVVSEQARLGGTAPANELAVQLSHRIERGELEAGPANLDVIRAGGW